MEQGEALLFAGVVLFVAGVFFNMALYPTYTSLSMELAGYETPATHWTKSDYAYYLSMDKIVMPLLNGVIALGIALLLTGALLAIAKKPKSPS